MDAIAFVFIVHELELALEPRNRLDRVAARPESPHHCERAREKERENQKERERERVRAIKSERERGRARGGGACILHK